MKQLYVVNNNGKYSDWCIWFVVADPDEWDGELEELLLLNISKWNKEATIDLVSPEWKIRGEDCTLTVAEYVDPSRFFSWRSSQEATPYVTPADPRSEDGRAGKSWYCEVDLGYPGQWRKRWIEKLLPEWQASDDERTRHFAKFVEISLTAEKWKR